MSKKADSEAVTALLAPGDDNAPNALDDVPCGYVSTLPDGTIVGVNRTFLEWTGLDRSTLLSGCKFHELLTVPGRLFYETHLRPLLLLQGKVSEIACHIACGPQGALPVMINSTLSVDATGHPQSIHTAVFRSTERTRYEQELRLARARADELASIVTSSMDAIISVTVDGRVMTWNPGAETMLGYSASAAIGQAMKDLVFAPDRADAIVAMHAKVAKGDPQRFDAVCRGRDGTPIDVSASLSLIRDLQGDVTGISVMLRDVFDRKQAERALAEAASRYRDVVEGSIQGIITQQDGRIVYANKAMAKLFGRATSEEFIGLSPFDDLIAENDKALFRERTNSAIQGTTLQRSLPWRAKRADGQAVWLSSTAQRSEWQGRDAVTSFYIDVTSAKEAERTVSVSEARYRALAEASDTIVWRTTPEGNVVFANMLWNALTGQSEEEKANWGWLDAIHPDDRDRTIAAWQASLESITLHKNEFRVRGANGDYRWFGVRGVPILNDDGTVLEWMGANTDIHERKMAEEELRARESRLRLIIDGALAFIGILDVDGTLQEANAAALGAGGLTREDVVGRKFWDCYWWSHDAAEVDRLKQAIATAAGGETVRYDTVVRMQGDVMMPIDFMLAPIRDDDGRIRLLVPSGSDISERKRAEQAVRESEARLRMALSAAKAGTWEAVPERGEMDASEQALALYGIAPGTVMSHELALSVIFPEDRQRVEMELQRTLQTGAPYRVELRARQLNGSIRWLYSQAELRPDLEPGRLVGLVQDITEQKQREQQINFLMREVNHRSKNLLGLVLSVARQTSGAANKDFVTHFTNRVQALSKSQDLLVEHDWQGVDLEELVRAQLSHFDGLIGTRIVITGQQLRLSPAAAQSIGMALHELATNASKYGALSDDKGLVEIAWQLSHPSGQQSSFNMRWTEVGGPPVVAPTQRGFGSTVTVKMVKLSLQGEVTEDFAPSGFIWQLDCPLHNVVDQ